MSLEGLCLALSSPVCALLCFLALEDKPHSTSRQWERLVNDGTTHKHTRAFSGYRPGSSGQGHLAASPPAPLPALQDRGVWAAAREGPGIVRVLSPTPSPHFLSPAFLGGGGVAPASGLRTRISKGCPLKRIPRSPDVGMSRARAMDSRIRTVAHRCATSLSPGRRQSRRGSSVAGREGACRVPSG